MCLARKQILYERQATISWQTKHSSYGSLAFCLLMTASTAVLSEKNKTLWLVNTEGQYDCSFIEMYSKCQERGKLPCSHESPVTAPYANPLASVVRCSTSDDVHVIGKKHDRPLKVCRNSSHAELSLRACISFKVAFSLLVMPISFWRRNVTLFIGNVSI